MQFSVGTEPPPTHLFLSPSNRDQLKEEMEEGSRNKKTIFVGGLSSDIDQTLLIETFSTFGDVIDVQIPPAQNKDKTQGTRRRSIIHILI